MVRQIMLGLGVLVLLVATTGVPVEARSGGTHHHASSTIDTHCVFPAYAKRHPDKCPDASAN